jgi:hypothetical protein
MTVYVIVLLVLVTIVMVGSAFLDRRRARRIEHDLARMRAEQPEQQVRPSQHDQPSGHDQPGPKNPQDQHRRRD